ncbi:hypothetical protein [uncultured Eubacterium sp.]|uniref:hypothetical protein n=1 Tax=uncultured Eubacterium sp. TaxID=165185 RepID=UPI002591C4C8|nr:hypothetical protein [uncultured Eubacterium sp.]
MKRRSIKYIGLVLLCVAGCMVVAACGQDKGSVVRNDECSVLSSETEAKDVEKSTDPADYEIGTRDHYLAVWAQEKGLSYTAAESQERLETDKIALGEDEAIGYATVDKECGSVSNGNGCNEKTAFSTDIRYIYQKTDGTITAIDNLAGVKVYLPEVPDATAQLSDPNIYQEEHGYRISVTGTLSFTLENADVTQGGEFVSVETSGNRSNVITTAKTFAILFQQSDVQK